MRDDGVPDYLHRSDSACNVSIHFPPWFSVEQRGYLLEREWHPSRGSSGSLLGPAGGDHLRRVSGLVRLTLF